jgi:energy-coupling factor transporter ATP-binding protein EcfA2
VCSDIIHYANRKLKVYKGNLTAFVAAVPEAQSYYKLEATEQEWRLPEPGFLEGVKSKDKAILKMHNVGFTYPSRDTPTFTGATLQVSLSSRVACVGPNGAGKSTLIKVLTGETEPTEGSCWKHPNLRIAYVAQHGERGERWGARLGVGVLYVHVACVCMCVCACACVCARLFVCMVFCVRVREQVDAGAIDRQAACWADCLTPFLHLLTPMIHPPPLLYPAAFHHIESHLDKTPNEYIQVIKQGWCARKDVTVCLVLGEAHQHAGGSKTAHVCIHSGAGIGVLASPC